MGNVLAVYGTFHFSTFREASNMTSAWRFPSGWISLFCWLGFFAGFWTSSIIRLGPHLPYPPHLTILRLFGIFKTARLRLIPAVWICRSLVLAVYVPFMYDRKKQSNSRAIDPSSKLSFFFFFFVPKKCLRKDSAVLLYTLVALPPFSPLPSPFCPHRRNVRIRLLHCMAGSEQFRRE